MRFHGVAMTGPFVNQKLSSLPVFDAGRDQARLVWLTNGTLWYGSDIEWVSFGGTGTGDASETEDMYSDLLRTTIFLNASWDGFENTNLINSTNMTYNEKYTRLEYTNGQYVESKNLFDALSYATYVDYVMVYVDYISDSVGQIEVSSNGGTNWSIVTNNKIFRIDSSIAGIDLRVRFTGIGTGTVNSLGVLYNKDLTAACTKYGLTYKRYTAAAGETIFAFNYFPGAIQVFLNGELLDGADYTATTGTEVVFTQPLLAGDIVYLISYSTSILNPDIDLSVFIRHDGSVVYTGDQSMGTKNLIDMADGVDLQDAVTVNQLNNLSSDFNLKILKAIAMGTWEGDYYANYTSNVNELITNIDIYIPNQVSPTWTANITYTYNVNDLPTTVTYTFDGKTVTQTYTFDANDLPDYMTQVTV